MRARTILAGVVLVIAAFFMPSAMPTLFASNCTVGFGNGSFQYGSNSCGTASLEYAETDLGGGLFQYDYTVNNLGTAGDLDLYSFTLYFSPDISLMSAITPAGWGANSDVGYVEAVRSNYLVDVQPGMSLGGFSFTFDGQIGSTDFFAGFIDPGDFSFLTGQFFGVTAPEDMADVPEPVSLLLVGTGLGALALRRRKQR